MCQSKTTVALVVSSNRHPPPEYDIGDPAENAPELQLIQSQTGYLGHLIIIPAQAAAPLALLHPVNGI